MRSADGTIAGNALRIDQAVRNYMSYAEISFAPRHTCQHVAVWRVGSRFSMNAMSPSHSCFRRGWYLGPPVAYSIAPEARGCHYRLTITYASTETRRCRRVHSSACNSAVERPL